MTLVYVDVTAPQWKPAVRCYLCSTADGLRLLPDGRFVCAGYCQRLNRRSINQLKHTREGAKPMHHPCCDTEVPGHAVGCFLVAHVTDRNGYRYVTRLGDHRQRPVPCRLCPATTFALGAVCDQCATVLAADTLLHPEHVA